MKERLLSLDVFRGVTIASMILVNNPGSWAHLYPPLGHAEWHGCTPTDLVFPFFLFIVGVSIAFSLPKQLQRNSTSEVNLRVLKRGLIIFGLGMFLAGFPHFGIKEMPLIARGIYYGALALFITSLIVMRSLESKRFDSDADAYNKKLAGYFTLGSLVLAIGLGAMYMDFSHIRIPGVLQRIALVFIACSLLFNYTSWKAQVGVLAGCLVTYWGLMTYVPVPDFGSPNLEPSHNLGAWLDRLLMEGHLWSQSKTWDPEGLLSTLPAIGTGIIGMLTGKWIQRNEDPATKTVWMFVAGSALLVLGMAWDMAFPINKKIWTSSYVLYSGGLALFGFAISYWIIDVMKYKNWAKPFAAFGLNAIVLFVMSGIVGKLFYLIKWQTAGGEFISLKSWCVDTFFNPFLSPLNASLAAAIVTVLFFLIPAWIMYKQKIIIKV